MTLSQVKRASAALALVCCQFSSSARTRSRALAMTANMAEVCCATLDPVNAKPLTSSLTVSFNHPT